MHNEFKIKNGTMVIDEYIDSQKKQHLQVVVSQFGDYVELNDKDCRLLYAELKKLIEETK